MKKLFAVLMFSVAVFSYAQQGAAPQKFALVIGNGDYTGISKLRNPVNDANDVAAALQALGFTVDKVLDGNLDRMETAADNLRRRLGASRNTYGFFFYAGHGVQSGGDNYLIPVDAGNIQTENHLRQRAFSVQTLLGNLSDAGNELNMIVLDACRDNPFGWARSGSRGLSVVGSAPAGSIIMYATSANSTAADGTGRNGLFTAQLLNNLKTPGLSVHEVFDKTGADVLRVSDGRQHPELSLRFFGASAAYLGTRPAAPVAVQPTPQPAPAPTPAPAVQPTPQPAPAPAPVTPAAQPQRITPTEMVRINGGTFTMGSPANEPQRESNETQHQVTVSSFYMGKYPVTQMEYQAVMGSNPSNFKGENLPVEQVSWYDALVFCNRLSMREGLSPAYRISGSTDPAAWGTVPTDSDATWDAVTIVAGSNGYRLPTEAQWEYACRAGTTTAYNTGARISNNTGWYNANSGNRTQPVGRKPANRLGLFDMHGNVWEWCWDWYGSYSGAQTDPTGASSGSDRVSRGGCWNDSARILRSAGRDFDDPNNRNYSKGFRLVRP